MAPQISNLRSLSGVKQLWGNGIQHFAHEIYEHGYTCGVHLGCKFLEGYLSLNQTKILPMIAWTGLLQLGN